MLTVRDLRRIAAARPEAVPDLLVHPNHLWPGAPMPDGNGNVHLCEADFLRNCQLLPVERVGQEPNRPGVTRYRITIGAHHLEAGLGDTGAPARGRPAERRALRRATGRDPLDGTIPPAGPEIIL
jgi:hypothetical protein